jgi:hypothetical protein
VVVGLHRDGDGAGALTGENGVVIDTAEMSADEDEDVVVAFCGSVMEKYHTFRVRCQSVLDELVSQRIVVPESPKVGPADTEGGADRPRKLPAQVIEQRRVVLEGNGDGGILGAGILAAVVDTKELSASVASITAK